MSATAFPGCTRHWRGGDTRRDARRVRTRLLDLLAQGVSPKDALDWLLAADMRSALGFLELQRVR